MGKKPLYKLNVEQREVARPKEKAGGTTIRRRNRALSVEEERSRIFIPKKGASDLKRKSKKSQSAVKRRTVRWGTARPSRQKMEAQSREEERASFRRPDQRTETRQKREARGKGKDSEVQPVPKTRAERRKGRPYFEEGTMQPARRST